MGEIADSPERNEPKVFGKTTRTTTMTTSRRTPTTSGASEATATSPTGTTGRTAMSTIPATAATTAGRRQQGAPCATRRELTRLRWRNRWLCTTSATSGSGFPPVPPYAGHEDVTCQQHLDHAHAHDAAAAGTATTPARRCFFRTPVRNLAYVPRIAHRSVRSRRSSHCPTGGPLTWSPSQATQ